MSEKTDTSWYLHLVDECRTIIVERTFESRWAIIDGYHELGERILQDHGNFEREKIYGENIAQRLAQSIGISKRTVNYAIQFAKQFPDLSLLPEGKNTSWSQICHKYLPQKKEQPEVRQLSPSSSLPVVQTGSLSDLLNFKSYPDFVSAQACILCGKSPVEKAHFPRTEKRGGEGWQVIPLCHECHHELHQCGIDTFLSNYKQRIFEYFYRLVLLVWEKQ